MQTTLGTDDNSDATNTTATFRATQDATQNTTPNASRDPAQLFTHLRAAADVVMTCDKPLVVHDFDADGLSAGAIVTSALVGAGKPHARIALKHLDAGKLATAVQFAKENQCNALVFCDIGSGMPDEIGAACKANNGWKAIIFDHHPPLKNHVQITSETNGRVLQANLHDFGFDGGYELSAASTCYHAFKHFPPAPGGKPFAQLGIVGATGDVQDKYGFQTLNKIMADEGERQGVVDVKTDWRAFGRVSRALVWFLSYMTEPYLPGLTGEDKACASLLADLGIPIKRNTTLTNGSVTDEWVTYNDLTPEMRQKLFSNVVLRATKAGATPESLEKMVGPVYTFPKDDQKSETSDSLEFATLLNACGRHKNDATGVDVCLGVPGALSRAKETILKHRQMLRAGLKDAEEHYQDRQTHYVLDLRGVVPDTVVGIVANAFAATRADSALKPTFSLATDEDDAGKTKVSGRANHKLIARGANMGRLMTKCSSAVLGIGGGHAAAAGASIPAGKEEEFLACAREVLAEQIAPKA